ncbi:hypothetical protein ACROYT_G038645 [Oculina patagonica]
MLIPFDSSSSPTNHEGKYYAPAIVQAVDDINNSSDLLPGHHLSFIWNDTECKEDQSLRALSYQVHDRQVDAIIGPGCSCQLEARLASALDIPMVSYMCNDPMSGLKKDLYATFARTNIQVEVRKLSSGLIKLLHKFNWTQVAILYENRTTYIRMKDAVIEEFEKNDIKILPEKTLLPDKCYSLLKHNRTCPESHVKPGELKSYMQNMFGKLKEDARILLYISEYVVARQTLEYAFDKGMTDGDYAFVMLQLNQEQYIRRRKNPGQIFVLLNLDEMRTCDYYQAIESVILVEINSTVVQETYDAFEEEVKQKFNRFRPGLYEEVDSHDKFPLANRSLQVPYFAAYLYDAVYQFAKALNKTLEINEPPTGRNVIEKMLNSSYESKLGTRVNIDLNGTADLADLRIVDIRWNKDGSRQNYCNENVPYGVEVGAITFNQEDARIRVDIDGVQWPNGKGIPADSPECGFDGLGCVVPSTDSTSTPNDDNSKIETVIGGVAGFAGLICIILFVIIIRQYMLKREMENLLWKINYKDIQWASTSSRVDSTDDNEETADESSQSSLIRKTSNQFTFTNFGFYKEHKVSVKQIGSKAIDLNKTTLLELKQMREFRHENFVQFYGATVDPPFICIVSTFCPRTLKDFLVCSDVKLDKTFISSLVSDIVKGMAYLQSTDLKYHGNLKSSNCLIDSRWTLKIADYGLMSMRSKCNLCPKNSSEDLLWTAPELLRQQYIRPTSGSQKREFYRKLVNLQKCDVYSFAIILQEFHTRKGPYSNNSNIATNEIIKRVKEAQVPIFRPTVLNIIEELEELRDLMKHCWEEDPDSRPDFTEIRRRMNRILVTKGMKTNIFDSMMYMMENYANNLEDIVTEKTGQLREAKRETEELLYKILPRPVAEQLKKGQQVDAEHFNEVSIYFSDIVGFTELSSESSPMQVVTLLNDLYTLFDDIISEYLVYKVETIGDAYMVVSGLPVKNGHNHAGEISRMALHLLDAVNTDFVVRHKPGFKLNLRIGIHSGPVVAGVVGSTMPRYCLFGDTVNTASRMESSGEARKIHISEATKEILEILGGFTIEERGEVFLKGKGNVRTYWLIDHKQRRRVRPPCSPKSRFLSRRKHLFGSVGDGDGLNASFITRSSTLRRSLKHASENPMTNSSNPDSPVKIVIDDVPVEEDTHKRKQSSHSITSV